MLENKYSSSENPQVRNLIQNQFQGKFKYITTCQGCKASSQLETSFYELEVSIKVKQFNNKLIVLCRVNLH